MPNVLPSPSLIFLLLLLLKYAFEFHPSNVFQTSWVRGGKTLGMLLLCETHYCTTETLILSENIVQSFNYFFFCSFVFYWIQTFMESEL